MVASEQTQKKKVCSKCQKEKPLSDFSPAKNRVGLRAACKACCCAYVKRLRRDGSQAQPKEKLGDGLKRCSKCNQVKTLAKFGTHAKGEYGRQAACQECEKKRHKEYRKTHPDVAKYHHHRMHMRHKERMKADESYRASQSLRWRKKGLKRMYNLTLTEYQDMLASQNGVCAICGKPETAHNQWGDLHLAIDHDHVTGRVRGLLCLSCNRKLGILEEREFVIAADAYLEQYSVQQVS